MRVTGGESGGARLAGPGRGFAIRPTPDKIRGMLFDVLRARDRLGGEFCDLFAGTGAVGIDALSHGFSRATFVDRSGRACRLIARNLERLRYSDRGMVIRGDVLAVIDRLTDAEHEYSVIFIDPPYEAGLAAATMNKLGDGRLMSADALVFIQHSQRERLSPQIGSLSLWRERRVGDTLLSTFSSGRDPRGG